VASALLNVGTFDTTEDAHDGICRRLLLGTMGGEVDWAGSSEVGISNLTVAIRSFAVPDMDLATLWLTESRWRTMVKQYINPGSLDATLGMVETHLAKSKRKSGTATLRLQPTDDLDESDGEEVVDLQTNLVEGKKSGRQVRRRWGSCMLALTYRNVPHPTVCLTSRTTYFGYLALLDMMVANVFAQKCGEITGVDVEDMHFVWHINLAQYHGFRSLADAVSEPKRAKTLAKWARDDEKIHKMKAEGRLGIHRVLVGLRRILRSDDEGVLYGDESFSSFARVRRRYHTQVHGYKYAQQFAGGTRLGGKNGVGAFKPVPSLMCDQLDFDAIGRK
jgi:hypothetical protein